MKTNELTSRIYDKLFDNIGMSEHHVELEHEIEIVDQWVENDTISIELDSGEVFMIKVRKF